MCNVIIDDVKVFARHILPSDELRMAKKITQEQQQQPTKPVVVGAKKNSKSKSEEKAGKNNTKQVWAKILP